MNTPLGSIYFHEDDYCQIELLPLSTLQHCATQMGIIDEFAARHSDGGIGYTDIYLRPEAPHSLAELKVSVSDLSTALQPHLPAYNSVFTGYSTHRELCPRTLAWGDDSFTLFANYQDEIIQRLWLSFRVPRENSPDRIALILRALPNSDRLLIADWSWSRIAPIHNAAALGEYLREQTDPD